MTGASRYRQVEVAGAPQDMGRQIGEAAGEQVRAFCESALRQVNRTVRVSRDAARETAEASLAYSEDYSPDMVAELRGVAEAARVSLTDLMLLQVRNQLQAEPEAGCTSLAIGGHSPHAGIIGQNWDNDPSLDELTLVLIRRPAGKPALINITQAGLIAYIGFNEAGLGVCLNTLPAPARKLGVPHYFTVRGIYEATSLEGAVNAVRCAHRAIPANIMLLSPEGPADLEVTPDDVCLLHPEGSSGIAHTNHCLHRELLPINERFPELIQSYSRKKRIDALLDLSPDHRPTLDEIKAALSDHQGYPRSICRHANDDAATGFWQTVFSVIMEPAAGRLHVSRGTPCDHPYQTYELA